MAGIITMLRPLCNYFPKKHKTFVFVFVNIWGYHAVCMTEDNCYKTLLLS